MIQKKIRGKLVCFHPFFGYDNINYKQIIEELRKEFLDSKFQIINSDAFFSLDHIIEVLKISFFAEERSTMAAKKIEIDFLMRIVGTNNIGNALKIGGLKINSYNILIALNNGISGMSKLKEKIEQLLGQSDDRILLTIEEQEKKLESFVRKLNTDFANEKMLINFLIEQAVLVSKK